MIKLNSPKFWQKTNWFSSLLTPLSYLYMLLGYVRKIFIKPIRLPAYVICVGNITIGGGGKTQIVRWLASHLKEKYKILVITKAYNSSLKKAKFVQESDLASDVGDESKLLAKNAAVIATKSLKQALDLIKKFDPEIIIFDDGMQSPRFQKDLTILSITTDRALGNQKIFPAGPLRQTLSSALKISDVAILVGNNGTANNLLSSYNLPIFNAQIVPESDDIIKINQNYLAFAGISNPNSFFQLLKKYNIKIDSCKSFPDHYLYTQKDIMNLRELALRLRLNLITTEKDYVRIDNPENIKHLPVKLSFEKKDKLLDLLYKKIQNQVSKN